jgi:4'-phosphopantetheinyl transferase
MGQRRDGDEPLTRYGADAPVPALVRGVCQVWWARLEDLRPQHDALLGNADRERRSRLLLAADRQRLTAAWAVARVVLGAATGMPPDRLQVDRSCPRCGAQHGKPQLTTAPHLHLSIAHSGSCIAVAVAQGSPIGVDVEAVVRLEQGELDLLVGDTLAEEERAELARQSGESRPRAFTTYWTRKEAVLKATADGLAAPLEELVVSPPSSPPRVLRWSGQAARIGRLTLHALHPPHGFVATLAVLDGPPTQVLEADAGPLLRCAIA